MDEDVAETSFLRIDDANDDEVYPSPAKKSHRSMSNSSWDPALRYEDGKKPTKTPARYATALRNAVPVRTEKGAKGCAKIDQAGLFSFVTYGWVFEYLLQAFKGNLSDNAWTCSIFDGANANLARMELLWNEEITTNKNDPKLWKVVYRFMKTRLWFSCAIFTFCLVFGFIGPTCFVRGLVAFAEKPLNDNSDQIDYGFGIILAFSILAVEFARVLAYGATWAVSYRTGIRVRSAVLGLLFKKLINSKTTQNNKAAEIINLFANDGQRLFDAVTFMPLVLVGPFVLVGGIIYLLIVIGPWSLTGIFIFFFFDVVQYFLGMTMVRCRERAIKKTENRVTLMGEIVHHIRLIKMNAWEENFIDRVEKMRHDEKVDLRTAGYAQSLAIACGPVVPVVAALLTFLGVVLSGNDLMASDAFSAITVFFVMLFGIRMIPYGSRYLAEAVVALRRIGALLQTEKWDNSVAQCSNPDLAVVFKNANLNWASNLVIETGKRPVKQQETEPISIKRDQFTLQNINLSIKKRELVGICGGVGSGKSALLTSIIGHMHFEKGDLELGGSVAYVSQSAWIQNATFQENILFGLEMNENRYFKAIDASQLRRDLATMPAGEHTEIGERGATLSGGQKARVSFARALFANRDIYLLDDVLASVDKNVADRIFNHAILEYLKNKTILMVTRDVKRLEKCDRVIFLENGQIVGDDKHEILIKACDAYREFCEISKHNAPLVSAHDEYVEEKDDGTLIIHERSSTSTTSPTRSQSRSVVHKDHDSTKVVQDEEDLGLAAMSWNIYKGYVKAAGSFLVWAVLIFSFILNVVATLFATYWLSRWLKKGHGEELVHENGTEVLRGHTSMADSPDTSFYATVYAISLVILAVSGLFKAWMFVKVSLNAASRLHNNMFKALMHGCALFFDQNPTGRILNRFSKDMDEIDVKLPFSIEVFLQNMFTCIGYLLVIAWVFPHFLFAAVPLFGIFLLFVMCFRAGIRSLKRSENISRSPLFDHITASIEGISVIHSYGQTNRFLETLKQRLDANSGSMFMFQSAMRWLAVWLDLLVVAITFVVALCIVLLTGKVSPADAGMAITFAIQMSGIFQFAVRTQTEMEAKMTSVERVVYYAQNITKEGEWNTLKGTDVPSGWPSKGQIDFADVKLRYRPNMEMSLNGITFTIKAKEKIGIIGRTGSGKSSLANVLYRLYPVSWGQIYIDGVDITTIGLHTLRRSMAIIPQDPVLFAGSIRSNLDPAGVFTDEQIWISLEKTHMKRQVQRLEKGLESEVISGGENFSVGERQLLCMARALLMKCRIVVLDEATASLDANMDKLIHQCLRDCLADCTVLLIAHKLENIADCDRVLLMDDGRMIAFDEPSLLLKKTGVELKKVVEEDAPLPEETIRQALDSSIIIIENDGTQSLASGDTTATPRIDHEKAIEIEDVSNISVKSLELVKTPSRESPVMIEKEQSSQSDDPDVEIVEDEDEKRVVALDDEKKNSREDSPTSSTEDHVVVSEKDLEDEGEKEEKEEKEETRLLEKKKKGKKGRKH
ncbi:unnamed protein product, partial [Mesorhabditis belari]|uniref:Multidrug resistance-associated protein 5 n=1 Tax=Mesorhabditis belari TaxID=2138241 RepID=A0AAF3JAZ8_9BILA